MEKEERKSLINQLNDKFQNEKYRGTDWKGVYLAGNGAKINGRLVAPLTISKKQMDQLIALKKFIEENDNITQEDLNVLLNTKFFKFKFLRKVNQTLPDLLSEIKQHSAIYVATYYANRVRVNEQIEKVLP